MRKPFGRRTACPEPDLSTWIVYVALTIYQDEASVAGQPAATSPALPIASSPRTPAQAAPYEVQLSDVCSAVKRLIEVVATARMDASGSKVGCWGG